MPVPTTFPYAALDPVLLPTPVRTLRFWVRPDTLDEDYANDQTGSVTTVNVICNGGDAALFIRYFLGFTQPATGSLLNRFLPYQLPYNDYLFAWSLKKVQTGNQVADFVPGWPDWSWIEYRATFVERPYAVLSDATAGAEYNRYLSVVGVPHGRELKINEWQYATDESPQKPLGIVGHRPEESEDLELVQYDFPCECYPYSTASSVINRVNDSTFTVVATQGPRTFEPETLLYRGVADPMVPYRMRNGRLAYRPRNLCTYKKDGWNKVRKVDDSLVGLVYLGTSIKPYRPTDLTVLFRPGA